MPAKFQLKQGAGRQFFFNLKAGNGEVILTSELYADKPSAVDGIQSVKANAGMDIRYERRNTRNGHTFFVLTAANGETIGKSELYSSPSAVENGIMSVKKNALGAPVEDMTERAA